MMATIEDLPKELLVDIFSRYILSEGREKFLRNIPRVCKEWNRLSTEASLWKDVEAYDLNFLQHLSRRGFLYKTQSLEFDYNQSFSEVNLSSVLKNIEDLKALGLRHIHANGDVIKPVTKHCPHLESLRLNISNPSYATSRDLDHFLTVCGKTLKHLNLIYNCSREAGRQLASGIASKCPLLETLAFTCSHGVTPFPIFKLRSGCLRMRELRLCYCKLLINTEREDSFFKCGFKELKKFTALDSDFSGIDVSTFLKDSIGLEYLELYDNDDLVFRNILKIPSDKVRHLEIHLKDPNKNLKVLKEAVCKWRRTLSVLDIAFWECDVSSVIECFLYDNPNPQLNKLAISKNINPNLFEKFIQQCHNLIHLEIDRVEYQGREKIKEALESLVKERGNFS